MERERKRRKQIKGKSRSWQRRSYVIDIQRFAGSYMRSSPSHKIKHIKINILDLISRPQQHLELDNRLLRNSQHLCLFIFLLLICAVKLFLFVVAKDTS